MNPTTTSEPVDPEDEVPEKGVSTWHDIQPGDRMLRKSNLRMGTADVYRQNKNQEEDQLTPERLKKGYHMPVTPFELQSLVFNASENKLTKLDTAQRKTQSLLASVVHKKGEFHMNYDRERKLTRDTMPRFSVFNYKRILEDRVKFFSALYRGASEEYLQRRIPFYRRKDHLLQEFYDYKIPFDRALWCMKLVCILTHNASQRSQKKSVLDVATLEISQACGRTTTHLLLRLEKNHGTEEFTEAVRKWKYMTGLMRYIYKDGALDKQEFLNDLTEAFQVFFIKGSLREPAVLQLFLEHYIFFLKDLSSCLILARRAATLLCQALGLLGEMNELNTKFENFKAENWEHFLGFEKIWMGTIQVAVKGVDDKEEEIPKLDNREMFDFLEELPDAVYFQDDEKKTVEELAEEELQNREVNRKIWAALKSEEQRKKLRRQKLEKARVEEEPMDLDESLPSTSQSIKASEIPKSDDEESESDSEGSMSSASSDEELDSDNDNEPVEEPLNEKGEVPKYAMPKGFFENLDSEHPDLWDPIRETGKPFVLPKKVLAKLSDVSFLNDAGAASKPSIPTEPIPVQELQKVPKKELNADDTFGHIKDEKDVKKSYPEWILKGDFGHPLFPFYPGPGGLALEPLKDEIDFSNPTPPDMPQMPPPIEFEPSPSASPRPVSERTGEKKSVEVEKEKEAVKEVLDDTPVVKTKDDLIIPLNLDDFESRIDSTRNSKDGEGEDFAATATSAKEAEKLNDPPVESSSEVPMEGVESAKSPVEKDKSSKDQEESMDVDEAEKNAEKPADAAADVSADADKGGEKEKDSEKGAEPMEVDKPDGAKATEPTPAEQEVVVAVKQKTPEKQPEPVKEKEPEVQVVQQESADPKTPEEVFTMLELIKMKQKKRRALKLVEIAGEIKERQAQDKKWEESTIHPVFRVYLENRAYRGPVHLISAMIQYLACTVPECFIWNNLVAPPREHRHRSVPQLCGSPLDYLPCDLTELPILEGQEDMIKNLHRRQWEIVQRSHAAEENWLPNGADVKKFGRIIDACVDVIGLLDSIDVEKPNAIYKASVKLFTFGDKLIKDEVLLRTKLLFKWCITEEREGSFRPVYVAKLLRYGLEKFGDNTIGGWNVMDLLFNFMSTEGPKYGSPNYQEQFDAVIGILIEMIREKIFAVTDILKELEKDQEIDFNNPLMARQHKQKIPKTSKRWKKMQEVDDTKLIHYHSEYTPKRLFMGKKTDLLERLLIMLPQLEINTDEIRIRKNLLFGLHPGDNIYFKRARHIVKRISKDFDARMYLEFDVSNKTVTAHKKLNQERLDDCLRMYRAQTYHDQHIILERLVSHYMDGIGKFLNKQTDCVPVPEIVNIICEMYEYSLDITSIFNFFEMVVPYLKAVDHRINCFRMDLLPGMYHTEIGFIFVSFFMKHYQRFLLHPRAGDIVEQCYDLVREMIKPTGRMITCWGRVVAIFVYHARTAVSKANPHVEKFSAEDKDFKNVFPNVKPVELDVNFFNEDLAAAKLALRGGTLRYDSYNDFKWIVGNLKPNETKKLASKRPTSRYSFVIRSFIEAKKHGRNFERINELANYCANVTANDPPLSEYWIGAVKGLCRLSLSSKHPFSELGKEIDITDCSTHYALTTFISCLAGKAAFYIPRLLSELAKDIFSLMLRPDGRLSFERTVDVPRKVGKTTETRTLSEAEPGVCLCLLIMAGLCCPADEPFGLSVHYRGIEKKKKRFKYTADERIMHMFHWFEMDDAMFRTVGQISLLLEALQGRCRDAKWVLPKSFISKNPPAEPNQPRHERATYRPQFLFNIAKAVLFTICEQDWVTLRMYRFVRIKNMEAFSQDKLKQNCLGQQILRIALRRKTERENIHSLFEAHKAGKKATIDKMFSFLNIWNFRATFFDLSLMIKEISLVPGKAADLLLLEIGKCCRDVFLSGFKTNATLPSVKKLADFRFRDINKYWLISPLVRMCPKPVIPPNVNVIADTVAGKFLLEAAALVNTTYDTPKERLQQCAWAMSKLPFINMIMTCLHSQSTQLAKDKFLYELYMQLQREVHRNHHKKSNWANRPEHRECNVLAVTFLSYIFHDLLKPTAVEVWGLLLYQLMFYGVINPHREKIVYDTCYDMLQYMVLWTLVAGDNMIHHDRYGSIRVRWPSYAGLMKKIRKECQDRHVKPSHAAVLRFLPIGKLQKPTISYKKYTKRTIRGPQNSIAKKYVAGEGLRNGRYAFLPEERPKTNAFDAMRNMGEGLTKGGWRFRMFQTTRLDKVAKTVQNQIRPMIPHTHSMHFHRSNMVMTDDMHSDVFLATPAHIMVKKVDPKPDEEEVKKKAAEKSSMEVSEAEKKADEQADDTQRKNNDQEAEKEAEKEKAIDGANDGTPKEIKKGSTQNEMPAPLAPAEVNKEMGTPEMPAPVARSSSATRGRGGGRKRNSGARGGGGPRAKRTNSRANVAETAAPAVVTEKATTSSAGHSSYHAPMRSNQPPMTSGSSDETKANIRNLLHRKQEKRNSIADAQAAAAAAATVAANAAAAAAAASNPTAPSNPQMSGPPNPGMYPMSSNPGMSSANPMMHAPPPYSSSSLNPFGNQPSFTAPMPPPITTMQHRSSGSQLTAEERHRIMEEQMHQKLAQQQLLMEQQNRQRELREREAREHQERLNRENQAREEQRRAQEENQRMMEQQRMMREREEARRREEMRKEEERRAYLAEQKRLAEEKMRQEEERRREEERQRKIMEERAREEERLRKEAEEQERLHRMEQERLQREQEERARKEREEQMRLERERIEKENRLREAREAEQRQRMEQQMRMQQQNQFMNQQAPPYGPGQPQGQPPSYQQTSYQNPPGYDQQSKQNLPPNYQQSSHGMPQGPGQAQQNQPPAYQQDSRYNQTQLMQQQMAARQQQAQQQQMQQQQPQRNQFGAQPEMQAQGTKLMQAQPSEAHAQQYQHTQAQSAMLQKEREKQYLQAKQTQAQAAAQQQQRFGDGRNPMPYGQQHGPQQQQPGSSQIPNPTNPTRLLPGSTVNPNPMQASQLQQNYQQQPVLGQPGPMQPGGQGASQQQPQVVTQQQFAGRQSGGQMGQGQGQPGQGFGQQVQGGFPQQQQQQIPNQGQANRPNQDGGYPQQGFNSHMTSQQQNYQQQQNPQQGQQNPQQQQWPQQQQANQMRAQQGLQGQQGQQQFPGQQQGFNQQNPGQPQQQMSQQQMIQQRQMQQQQQNPAQQGNQYDGTGNFGNTGNRNANILNQSMEDAGLNQGSNQQGSVTQNQGQYTQQQLQQMQQRSQQQQQRQPGMAQPGMGQPGMGQHGMGQPGMGQQPGMQQQSAMGQPGMARGTMGQQQAQQAPQQAQQQQQQRAMNQMGGQPGYNMGGQPMQGQVPGQMTQEQYNARRLQAQQYQQQQMQQQQAAQARMQQQGGGQMQQMPGFDAQGQQQQYPPLQHRGQGPQVQGMGNQQQFYQQNDQRMQQQIPPGQQQQQQQQQGQQHQNYGMGQYPQQYQ